MLSFWDKKRKPDQSVAVHSVMHQTEKHSKVAISEETGFFYEFLKNHIFQKLTTDFENRTKRHAETKPSVFLDVGH